MSEDEMGWWIIVYMVCTFLGFAAAFTFGFPIWIGLLVGAAIPAAFQLAGFLFGLFLVGGFIYVIDVLTGKRK